MKLYLLNLGQCDVDKGRVLTPGSGVGERVVIPIVGYLIETDDGRRTHPDDGDGAIVSARTGMVRSVC